MKSSQDASKNIGNSVLIFLVNPLIHQSVRVVIVVELDQVVRVVQVVQGVQGVNLVMAVKVVSQNDMLS